MSKQSERYDDYPTMGVYGDYGWRQNTGGHPSADYETFRVSDGTVVEYHMYEYDAEFAAQYHAELAQA